jgi:ribosomal protein S27AE
MTFAMAQVAQDQETVAPTANAPKDTVLGQVLGKEDAQDDLLSESDDEQTKIQPAVASSPEPRKLRTTSALMDFAASSSGKDLQLSGSFSNKMSSGSGTSALAQLAAAKQSQQHRSSSLVDVANSMNIEGSMNTNVKVSVDLQSIAKQIDEESKDQQIRKSQLISTALHDAKKQVVQEQRRHTNMVLREALDATVQEEEEIKRAANILQRKQAKQQVLSSDNQEDEQYDDDTGETPEQQNSIKKNKKAVKEKSVDHFVLKKRQGLTGHGGLKKTKPPLNRFNKDKLSKFQLDCLTLTQKRLLLAMLVNNNTVDNRNNQEDSKEKLQHMLDLSKAKHSLKTNKSKKTKDQIYAKLDDIRHCKFKPRIGRGSSESSSTKKNNNQDDDEEEDTSSSSKAEDFIRRMEATERARQQNLHRTREERIYLAQVDKKECPQCGNSQSYAEFQQKRQKCPNCGVKYQRRLAWGDIGATFFERLDFQEEQKLSWVENMTNKQAKEIQDMLNMRKIVFDKETHQLTEVVLTPPQWVSTVHNL